VTTTEIKGVIRGVALILLVALADYLTGSEISFSIFYIAPIARVAWLAGRRWGVVFAILSSLLWYAADRAAGLQASHFLIPVWNAFARMGLFLMTVEAAVRLRSSLDRERSLARVDPLTGLANARVFRESVERELARSKRYRHVVSLAYIDVDNFKWVNDNRGHQGGDNLLTQLGELLRGKLRGTDTVARLGGDEFAVLMPETKADTATLALEKVRASLRLLAKQEALPVTLSIGVVEFERFPGDADAMLHAADELMYRAKSTGKDAIQARVFRDSASITDSMG
jgi:diguanylate cyclase (GGDEF)-like protein